MPRKQGGAKKKNKAEAKLQNKNKDKVKVDPTFGLKNKKGSKNRQFVKNAQNNMNSQEIQKKKEKHKQKKERAKAEAYEKEQMSIFATVGGNNLFQSKLQKKKNKDKNNNEEEKIENKEDEEDEFTGPLDEVLDKMRARLDGRTDLHPVNPNSYVEWLHAFVSEKEAAKAAKTKKKMQKKGKKALTGRELFLMDQSVFVDDAEAEDEYVFEKEFNNGNEMKYEMKNDNLNDNNIINGHNNNIQNGNINNNNDNQHNSNNENNNNNNSNEIFDPSLNVVDESLFLEDDFGDMPFDDDDGTIDEIDKNAEMEIAD